MKLRLIKKLAKSYFKILLKIHKFMLLSSNNTVITLLLCWDIKNNSKIYMKI